jgi:HlyD family secretion protein
MARISIAVVLALLAFAGGWVTHWRWPALVGGPVGQVVPAGAPAKPDSTPRIVAQGRLQPLGGLVSVILPPGQQIGEVHVRELDSVVAGKTRLLTLKSRELLQLHVDLAAAQKTEVALEFARNRLNADLAVRSAEQTLDSARFRLQQLQSSTGIRVSEMELDSARFRLQQLQSSTGIRVAEMELDSARSQLDSLTALSRDPLTATLVSLRELERLRTGVETSQLQLDAAREEHRTGLEAASNAVTAAEASLADARQAAEMARQVEVESQSPQLAEEIARKQLAEAEVLAPVSGTVLRVLLQPGETVTTSPVMQLGDLEQMECVAEVSELFASRIEPGFDATLTSPSIGRPLAGKVTSVGQVIGMASLPDPSPLALVDRKTIEVRILLDAEDVPAARGFSNLQVTVELAPSRGDGPAPTSASGNE